ncbi:MULTISPECIES: efflux RND transporter permease subunit [unclassified Nitrosomonas]|jgi:HAE1 family hydrophobic/amphiphilic exporter-1|uniref:efflux RND transporter permease subunit n=1 Tax=unclassified Nitrosomonas TaxID=2609265 RepID=UPI0008897DD2|nr:MULTISPECIES: efflux RND transporter permease subunit [unclassified Nitrosomonas]SDH84885.1 hydrophobic/amphiphilic exporter-1, HAE1 family [Nitrosomonas sp. Nm132]SDZ16249.1 hydrophobic/amphiphilic exporter-1, HAE1 family [Nitrosomonas sp. Nm58]
MFSIFLKRPVMAIVLSLMFLFMGFLAMKTLPVSQFPDIAPARVTVSVSFPGASAEVLVKSSLILLERAINGVPGMRYITSDATSAGEATIQVYFNQGVDPNIAMVNVKTRVDQMMSRLPALVELEGVIVNFVQPSMLMYVNIFSTDKNADQKLLYNYAYVNVIPEIQRITGIAQATILGSRQYAMRIWLNPERMRVYHVSAEDVMKALADQSIIGRPGRLGQSTGKAAESKEYVLVYKGRFNKPEEYEDIIIRSSSEGKILRIKDVAEVELNSEFYNIYSDKDGYPSASIVLKQNYNTNAQTVIAATKEKLEELKKSFPEGMDYEINYDVSRFVEASIEQVLHTLVEAFILVSLVVFIFLGDWRSTLIPVLAVPVSLVGAFAVMSAFGLSINLITLFALVLAIGIVVDDAIVVVEAVHAKMADEHCSPYEASRRVLGEIGGAIVAITLVMVSVFIPIAFMPGPVGVFYREFSITMASSIIISAIVALSLAPVLCAMILKNTHGQPKRKDPISLLINGFNFVFEKVTGRYVRLMNIMVTRRIVTLLVLAGFSFGIFMVSKILPSGFIPGEDQGMIYAIIQTPPGSTIEVTNKVARELEMLAEKIEGVKSISSLAGYEVLTEGRGSNAGTVIINLKDWSERKHSVTEIIEELEEKSHDMGAVIEYFQPPAVPGYGAASGLSFRLVDKTINTDYYEFDEITKNYMKALRERKELTGLFTFYAANYPQYELVIDNKLAMQKGVNINDAMNQLDIMIGSTYEQGFIRFNNFFKVYAQALPEFRRAPEDVLKYFVKNDEGEMVPYSAFMTMVKKQGPNELTRYNLYNTAAIRAEPAKGYTTGDAINTVLEVAKDTLPKGFDIAWEGLTFDEAARGNEALAIFFVVILFVYLVLAAQYESFLLPLAVILSLPPGIFGAFFLLKELGLANDVYSQLGMVMLVGLLGKNAVLIVEFASQKQAQGMTVMQAAIAGAQTRFRPILMTSFAFIAGLVPLAMATGAGAIGNRTIGTSALGGMIFGTVFGVIIIPGLYYIFAKMAEGRKLIKDEDLGPLTETYDYGPSNEIKD